MEAVARTCALLTSADPSPLWLEPIDVESFVWNRDRTVFYAPRTVTYRPHYAPIEDEL